MNNNNIIINIDTLCLYGIKIRKPAAIQFFKGWITKGGDWEGLQVQQFRWWRKLVW